MPLAALCLVVLGGLGLNRPLARARQEDADSARPVFLVFGLAVLLLAVAVAFGVNASPSALLLSVAMCVLACAATASLLRAPRSRQSLAAVALLVLGGVELFVVHPQARRIATVSIEEALKPPAVVRWLKQDPELFRIFSLWSLNPVVYPLGRLHALLPAGVPAIWGIDTTGVSLSLYLKRTLVVMEAARYALLYDQRAAERLARFLGAVNVKYVIAEPARVLPGWQPAFVSEDAIVWRNPHFQPRLFLVGHVVAERLNEESSPPAAADSAFRGLREKLADWSLFQGDATAFERIMTDAVDYSRTAVVDADPLPEVGPVDPGATVEFEWGRDEIRARVNTASPALLVISNSFHSGWTATLNGLPAPIHRTNWLVMGVRVPAGASNLTLTYSTPGLYLGAGISCFSLVLFVAIAATSTRRRLLTKRPGAE